jgi:hypothetical protein
MSHRRIVVRKTFSGGMRPEGRRIFQKTAENPAFLCVCAENVLFLVSSNEVLTAFTPIEKIERQNHIGQEPLWAMMKK